MNHRDVTNTVTHTSDCHTHGVRCRKFSHLSLLLKELALPDRVVQLGVGVTDLFLHDEELEALGQPFLGSVPGRT